MSRSERCDWDTLRIPYLAHVSWLRTVLYKCRGVYLPTPQVPCEKLAPIFASTRDRRTQSIWLKLFRPDDVNGPFTEWSSLGCRPFLHGGQGCRIPASSVFAVYCYPGSALGTRQNRMRTGHVRQRWRPISGNSTFFGHLSERSA